MAVNLATPEGQLRFEVGDTMDVPIMSDAEYTYILSKHSNIVADSVLDALYAILARMSFKTRQRLDRIEFYGNQAFEQYMKFVEDKIKQIQGIGFVANNFNVYAGGMSKQDAANYAADSDLIQFKNPLDKCQDNFY